MKSFEERAREVHGDKYDYSRVNYVNGIVKIEIICPEHGSFFQTPKKHLAGHGCPHKDCVKNKLESTNKERYGTARPLQNKTVQERVVETSMRVYGVSNPSMSQDVKQKRVETCQERYGVNYSCQASEVISKKNATNQAIYGGDSPFCSSEVRERAVVTVFEKYGVQRAMQSPVIQKRVVQTNMFRRGVPYVTQHCDVISKIIASKRENGTFCTSKPEDDLYQELVGLFGQDDVLRNYDSDSRYSFACDFYIKSRDMFIELNAHWTHGHHWFDKTKDSVTLDSWLEKSQDSEFYKNAVYVWTEHDLKKRETAKENNLNYVVFWDNKLRDVVLWLSLNCPDGCDWEREYSWLPKRELLKLNKVTLTGTWANLSQVAKYYQQDVFYRREKALWQENVTWKNQGIPARVFLYYNRLRYQGKNPVQLSDFDILRGFGIAGMLRSYSVFNANLMTQAVYKYNIKSIYDPCAGWGERMLFCKTHDIKYFGVDVNFDLKSGYENMMEDCDIKEQSIVFADSSCVPLSGQYDCVFTCPPYGSLEIYSVNGAENLGHDAFLNWWGRVVKNSLTVKPKYFMFQVNQKWLSSMTDVVVKYGFKVIDKFDFEILASHMNKTTKREFESLVVLEKV